MTVSIQPKRNLCTATHVEGGPCERVGRGRHPQAQEHLRLQEAGTRHGPTLPHCSQEEPTCQCLDFLLLVCRIVNRYISVVLSHSVCGALLQQPQETTTVRYQEKWGEHQGRNARRSEGLYKEGLDF